MTIPGWPSLLFLAFLGLWLPLLAWRSARRFRAAESRTGGLPSRTKIWQGTFFLQIGILLLAVAVGRSFGFRFLALPRVGWQEFAVAGAAFLVCLGLRWWARRSRSEEERRRLVVFTIAPRSRGEWSWWLAAVLAAGVAEEIAYRGVALAILWYSLGNVYAAALISATIFALAHSVQGLKSMAIVFLIGLTMHGVVGLTDSMLYAIGVHIAYDLFAGWRIAREASTFERTTAGALPPAQPA